MKRLTVIILAFFTLQLVSGCEDENKEITNFLNFDYKTVNKKVGDCDDIAACGKIFISYPVFINNIETVDSKLNYDIIKNITSFYATKTIKETSEKFIIDYSEFINEFPEVASNKWEVEITYKILENNEDLLSLLFTMKGYTGGAHGFLNQTYINYNPETGKKLSLKDVVNNMDKLTAISKDIFFDKYDIDPNESLVSQDYNFEDDIFSLNNNFKLNSEGITFHYNHYEIASYAQGDFDFTIHMDKLEGMLK